ncbi:MAG: restriction endonuclease [Pseudomonadota bacterium]
MKISYETRYTVPDLLVGKAVVSQPIVNYNQNGTIKNVVADIGLEEIDAIERCSVRDVELLGAKITEKLQRLERRYAKFLKDNAAAKSEEEVCERNERLAKEREQLDNLVNATLSVDDAIDWNELKDTKTFLITPENLIPDAAKRRLLEFSRKGVPLTISSSTLGERPSKAVIEQRFSFLARLFSKKKIAAAYSAAMSSWNKRVSDAERLLATTAEKYEKLKRSFEYRQQTANDAVEAMRVRYEGADPPAIEEYCDLVLNRSEYPDSIPQDRQLSYQADSRLLIIDHVLPAAAALPTVESCRFIKSRAEITEKQIPVSQQKKRYQSVLYQLCIRTLHELFEADVIDAIDAVAYNGLVTSTNPATGNREEKVVLSVVAEKAEFMGFDLSKIDPKATFKHLKGISGASLIDLPAVKPLVVIDKSDSRFVDDRETLDAVDESVNLASMDWEDFEHLVRELFQKEFETSGGEVKVTRASADGGVDAIAFDPDPIRGGKVVIQAKRYTNTVGVSAVRDLYGTVMNEGATKGVIVTTSNYSADSYNFAKDKPLTLLNGQNLLYLLQKHGTRATIDIQAAKQQK